MAIDKRFVSMLDENIRDISNALKLKATDKYIELSKWKIFSNKAIKLSEKKIRLERELEECITEMNNTQPTVSTYHLDTWDWHISNEADNIITSISFSSEYKNKSWYNSNTIFKTEELILESMIKTKEIISIQNFEVIAKQTRTIFNMAASNKEARNILLTFQSKNWNALGIELPALNPLANFDISADGTINMKALAKNNS